MHRRWMSLPILTSCVSAFYPYHEPKDDSGVGKRFIPYQIPHNTHQSHNDLVTIDIKKMPVSYGVLSKSMFTNTLQQKRDNTFPVVISSKPTASNAMAVSQDGSDYSYFSTVSFGSKKQPMYMLIDTGSANTWVMGQDCASTSCSIHNLFGKSDSNTLVTSPNSKWSLTYGTGSVSGYTASDTVSFANFTLPNMGFGLAITASDDFNSYPMDGILGLGRSTSNELGVPTLMEVIASQGHLLANALAIHLNRGSDNTKDGSITFGGVDTTKFSGSISYTKTVNTNAWEIAVDDTYVNNQACNFNGKSAIIDTGTSYVLMPASDAQVLHGLIPNSSHNGETFTIPCNTVTTIQVSFNGVKYSISPKDYVGGATSTAGTCTSNIIGHQAFGPNQWILGDVFLKNVYTVFDFDGGRVGFAPTGTGGNAGSFLVSSSSSSSSVTSSIITSTATMSSQQSSTMAVSKSSASATSAGSGTSSSSTAKATETSMGNPFDVNSGSSSGSNSGSNSSNQHSGAGILRSDITLIWTIALAFFLGLLL